jgi:hypothetical protein
LKSFDLAGLPVGPDTRLVALGLSNSYSLLEASVEAAKAVDIDPLELVAAADIFGIEG